MPTSDAYDAVIKFARERGAVLAHTKGSSPPYLWSLLEIKYLCRMRSIEVVRLTDAHASEQGLYMSVANSNAVVLVPHLVYCEPRAPGQSICSDLAVQFSTQICFIRRCDAMPRTAVPPNCQESHR